VEWSTYNFQYADAEMLRKRFDMDEAEGIRMAEKDLVLPTYDHCLKCSHTFNLVNGGRSAWRRGRATSGASATWPG